MKTKKIFLLINLIVMFSLNAKSLNFAIEEHKLSFEGPSGYQVLRGYLGRDIVLLGPEDGKKRISIFIEVTDGERVDLNKERESLVEYSKNKKDWLKRKNGELFSLEVNKKDLKTQKDFLYNELVYKLGKSVFVEGDIFLKCSKSSSLNLSYLVLKEKFKTFKPLLNSLVEGIKCD